MQGPAPTDHLFNPSGTLYLRLQQRDASALSFLYDKYSLALYAHILSAVNNADQATAVLETCYLRIWEGAAQFDPHKSSLFAWMLAIVREELLRQERKPVSDNPPANTINQALTEIKGLTDLVNRLPEPCKSILRLSYFENASDEAIAIRVNRDITAVKQCKNTGLAILHRMIATQEEIKKPSPISERALAF